MPARIGFDNLARRPEALARAYAGSVGMNTPPGRMVTPHLSDCWRSAPGVNATWIEFEITSVEDIDTVALIGTNLTELADWRIRIGIVDLLVPGNVAFDSGIVNAGVVGHWGLAARYLPQLFPGNRVRIDLEDPSLSEIEVPRVWFGRSWRPTYGFKFGHQQKLFDHSVVTESEYGSTFIDIRPSRRGYTLEFGVMSAADHREVRRLHRLCGASRELLLCLDDQSPELGEDTLLVLPQGDPGPLASVEGGFWSWSLDCKERI